MIALRLPAKYVGATFRSPAGVGLGAGSWFDRLTTSGDNPLALSQSKGECSAEVQS